MWKQRRRPGRRSGDKTEETDEKEKKEEAEEEEKQECGSEQGGKKEESEEEIEEEKGGKEEEEEKEKEEEEEEKVSLMPEWLLPDGDVCFTVPKRHSVVEESKVLPLSFLWKFNMLNKKKRGSPPRWRSYGYCLGVHKCSLCDFVEAPLTPVGRSKDSLPPPANTTCPQHPEHKLVHHSCSCSNVLSDDGDIWEVKHVGKHDHVPPPLTNRSLPPDQMLEFQRIVCAAPEASPTNLKMGHATREPVSKISPCLHNTRRVARERMKTLLKASTSSSSIADLISFKERVSTAWVRGCDLFGPNPHIILQDDHMLEISSICGGPLQTDTVEGFLSEPKLTGSREPNLTVTSGCDIVLEKWVPLTISILFGKRGEDYHLIREREQDEE